MLRVTFFIGWEGSDLSVTKCNIFNGWEGSKLQRNIEKCYAKSMLFQGTEDRK